MLFAFCSSCISYSNGCILWNKSCVRRENAHKGNLFQFSEYNNIKVKYSTIYRKVICQSGEMVSYCRRDGFLVLCVKHLIGMV